jgi:hypothetical protein
MVSRAASIRGQGGLGRLPPWLQGTPVAVAALWLGSAAGLLNLTPGAFYNDDLPNTLSTAAARASLAAFGLALALHRRRTPGGQGPALWGAALWGLGAGLGGTLLVAAMPAFGPWMGALQGCLRGVSPVELLPSFGQIVLGALLSLAVTFALFVAHFAPSLALSLLVGLAAFPVFSSLFEEDDAKAAPPAALFRSGLWLGALGLASLWARSEGPGRWLAWACVGLGEAFLFLAHLNTWRLRQGPDAALASALRARAAEPPEPPLPVGAAHLVLAAEPFAWEFSVSLAPDDRRPTPRAPALSALAPGAGAEQARLAALGRWSALGAFFFAVAALLSLV